MNDLSNSLIIEEKQTLELDEFNLEIGKYLGLLSPEIHYFQVKIAQKGKKNKLGLLRVGTIDSCLNYELQLREKLPNYGMFNKLLLAQKENSVVINLSPQKNLQKDTLEILKPKTAQPLQEYISILEDDPWDDQKTQKILKWEEPKKTNDYLEEEYYDEFSSENNSEKLILLTYLPEEKNTLDYWLKQPHSQDEYLALIIQICQCFSYIYQHEWCFLELLPQFIEVTNPIQFYDLTSIHRVGEILNTGILGTYSAPELTLGNKVDQNMSTYTIGALLYQCLHKELLDQSQIFNLKLKPIPHFYQILKIALSPVVEERFYLSQLLSLLIDIRQQSKKPIIDWTFVSKSTVGLSLHRLHNEDSFGIRYERNNNSDTQIFGVVADGMGGMSEGEVASKIAVDTVINEPIPPDLKSIENKQKWLTYLVGKANQTINNQVVDGGTTLSIVWGFSNQLLIAHVGDSRIYLIRKGAICQLSEDHSLVQMLLSGGDISYEQSISHSQKNVLTKSLGSKPKLSQGYVQDLSYSYKNLSLKLEDQDILLLCSDGVWDLVSATELAEIFVNNQEINLGVEKVIEQVLENGAKDNATILALQCHITNII